MHALREPDDVMRLERLGSLHASRLSFLPILLRRIQDEKWSFQKTAFEINEDFTGHAVYTAITPSRPYSLVVFAHYLDPENRTDRVIANSWDATFTLFDGIPNSDDIARLGRNVPFQEVGRLQSSELTLSRANKSVRLWDSVVEALSMGQQPAIELLDDIGYLMRTTAVYGSGKFGACDREMMLDRPELKPTFQAEMLTVLMIRQFARDWVEYEAYLRAPGMAVTLDEKLAIRLGIGNSTGLGMAPFLINHPVLIDHWIRARETAIARIQNVVEVTSRDRELVMQLINRVRADFEFWHSIDIEQTCSISALKNDLHQLTDWFHAHPATKSLWVRVMQYAREQLGLEAQELIASMILEPYPDLVDPLVDDMSVQQSELKPVDGSITISDTCHKIDYYYDWLNEIDWQNTNETALLWYVSEEKLEPRLGYRNDYTLEPYEQPLGPASDIAAFREALRFWAPDACLAEFLMQNPWHRLAAMRLQWIAKNQYGEIRGNTIGSALRPVDLLRCKLSFFGATRFDPRSDRWLRITLCRHAPYLDQIVNMDPFWIYG